MQTASKKTVWAWTMYDWANSVYSLVITTTFFPIYFLGATRNAYGEDTVPFLGRTFKNSSLYDYALAASYAIVVLLSPILSSIADSRGNKKTFMRFFVYLGSLACCGLFFFKGQNLNVGYGLLCFMLATIGFLGSLVFYNSYLPEIAAAEDRDRISARGFTMGYIGSVLLQLVGFGLVVYYSGKDDSVSGPVITFLLVGLWWFGFSQIPFRHLPNGTAAVATHKKNFLTEGFEELRKVWHQVMALPVLKRFLFSFFFYSMGVQTVMLAATQFGSKLLKLPDTMLIVTVVIIQLVAIPGAIGMARLSQRWGNIRVIMLAVVLWILLCFGAYQVANLAEAGVRADYYFYALAVGVGLVMGGIQAMSRSAYSKFIPTQETGELDFISGEKLPASGTPPLHNTSFFSFYEVTEKLAIVIGIFTFGIIDERLDMKYSVLALIVFFTIGLIGLIYTRQKQKALHATA